MLTLSQHETYDVFAQKDTSKITVGLIRKTNYGKFIGIVFFPTRTVHLPTEYSSKEETLEAIGKYPNLLETLGIKVDK